MIRQQSRSIFRDKQVTACGNVRGGGELVADAATQFPAGEINGGAASVVRAASNDAYSPYSRAADRGLARALAAILATAILGDTGTPGGSSSFGRLPARTGAFASGLDPCSLARKRCADS